MECQFHDIQTHCGCQVKKCEYCQIVSKSTSWCFLHKEAHEQKCIDTLMCTCGFSSDSFEFNAAHCGKILDRSPDSLDSLCLACTTVCCPNCQRDCDCPSYDKNCIVCLPNPKEDFCGGYIGACDCRRNNW